MKWVCTVCGYTYEGDNPPEKCPQCGVPADKFKKVEGEMVWADEHVVGVAKDVDSEIVQGLRDNFMGECTEVGMLLQNLLNFSAKLLQTPQKRTCR